MEYQEAFMEYQEAFVEYVLSVMVPVGRGVSLGASYHLIEGIEDELAFVNKPAHMNEPYYSSPSRITGVLKWQF